MTTPASPQNGPDRQQDSRTPGVGGAPGFGRPVSNPFKTPPATPGRPGTPLEKAAAKPAEKNAVPFDKRPVPTVPASAKAAYPSAIKTSATTTKSAQPPKPVPPVEKMSDRSSSQASGESNKTAARSASQQARSAAAEAGEHAKAAQAAADRAAKAKKIADANADVAAKTAAELVATEAIKSGKTADGKAPSEIDLAKARLRAAAAAIDPLRTVRQHPYISTGVAFAGGFALGGLPFGAGSLSTIVSFSLRTLIPRLIPLLTSGLNVAAATKNVQAASQAEEASDTAQAVVDDAQAGS